MTNLAAFSFNDNQVRVLMIDGEPWFVVKDLCKTLDISNPSQALSRLDEDEKRSLSYGEVIILSDDPDTTRLLAVSESGMFALVLSSRKPEARPFRKWVTSEVLPSIRKSGTYSTLRSAPQVQEIGSAIIAFLGRIFIFRCYLRNFLMTVYFTLKVRLSGCPMFPHPIAVHLLF